MQGIIAIGVIVMLLGGCRYQPDEPRDAKIPRPKTVTPAYVEVEPFQAGSEETQPLIMRAVLRCHQDPQGRTRCELEVPRARARMG